MFNSFKSFQRLTATLQSLDILSTYYLVRIFFLFWRFIDIHFLRIFFISPGLADNPFHAMDQKISKLRFKKAAFEDKDSLVRWACNFMSNFDVANCLKACPDFDNLQLLSHLQGDP